MSMPKDYEAFLEFLEYLREKGLMKSSTVSARKASSSKVLEQLSDEELKDVTAIDIDDVMQRFANLQGKKYSPGSLNTYKSRLSASIDEFRSYLSDPMSYRPQTQSRTRTAKKKKEDGRQPVGLPDISSSKPTEPKLHSDISPPNTTILPIPLRENLIVRIQGIPFDLTSSEANKLSAVIQAMALVE